MLLGAGIHNHADCMRSGPAPPCCFRAMRSKTAGFRRMKNGARAGYIFKWIKYLAEEVCMEICRRTPLGRERISVYLPPAKIRRGFGIILMTMTSSRDATAPPILSS